MAPEPTPSAKRTVVMIGRDYTSTRILYHALAKHFSIARVFLERPPSFASFWRSRARRFGVARAVGQAFFQLGAEPLIYLGSRQRFAALGRAHGFDESPVEAEKSTWIDSVNAEEAIAAITALEPAVIVVNATRILTRETLARLQAPVINLHGGLNPLYRGLHGAYWALVQGKPEECGVTVHLIDSGVDTGPILGQAIIHPESADTLATYRFHQLAAGIPLMIQGIRDLLDGTSRPLSPPAGTSRLWSDPTLGEYLVNRFRHGVR